MFFGSFYTDYSSLSSMDNEGEVYTDSIECWTSSGRDQAQIMRNLVDSGFVKQNKTKVTLKLVDGGALLPSILAGIGPDVSLDPTGGVIDYAIRGVCLPLENYQDFDVINRSVDFEKVNTIFDEQRKKTREFLSKVFETYQTENMES